MKPKEKGDMAIGKAIAHFMTHGFEVCLPIGDKRDYDLIVERNGILARIQVKYAGLYANNTCKAALRVMGGNQSFHTIKKYNDSSFEYLFVYTAKDESFLVPWKDLKVRSEISIEASQYSSYKITPG